MAMQEKTISPAMSTVLSYFREELQPVIADLQVLAKEAAGFKVGFVESIARKKLHELEERYAKSMALFMEVYKKWHFPDEMFKGIGASYNAEVLAEYQGLKPALSEHINEGFRVLGFIDRVVGGARSVADNRVAVLLSMAAITISIVTAIIQS